MGNEPPAERPIEQTSRETSESSVATHRRAERMRTFTYHPRPEGRM